MSFSYNDTGDPNAAGDDEIKAFIGQIGSNVVSNTLIKHWVVPVNVNRCDADSDGDVDQTDLVIIRGQNLKPASSVNDPRDGNGDMVINVADVRFCQLRLTK